MKDYVGRTDSVFNECHGWCRAETVGDKRLESRIQSKAQLSLSSRGIQIFLLILGEHGPFLFSMKSVRVRQVQLESLRFFLNFRMETVLDAVSVEQLHQQGCGVGPGNARNGNQLQQLMDSSDSW